MCVLCLNQSKRVSTDRFSSFIASAGGIDILILLANGCVGSLARSPASGISTCFRSTCKSPESPRPGRRLPDPRCARNEWPLSWLRCSVNLRLARLIGLPHERRPQFQSGRFGLRTAGAARCEQRLVRDGGRPLPSAKRSDVDLLGDAQRVIEFHAKVANRAVHLGVTQQELDRSEVASLSIDQRSFGPAERMRAIPARIEPDR